MGFNFKKLAKSALKIAGKVAKPLLAQTPIGQAVLKGQQTLKALGVNLKAARLGKEQPSSVMAAASKIASPLASRSAPAKKSKASSGLTAPELRMMSSRPTAKKKLKRAQIGFALPRDAFRAAEYRENTSRSKISKPKTKRVPPKGGLDLKAMSADWRAAGKPGTWIGWIKANPRKKAS